MPSENLDRSIVTNAANEVYIRFCVFSKHHSLVQITKMLKQAPSGFVVKGSSLPGLDVISNLNYWSLSSERHLLSLDLNEHLSWLADRLRPSKLALSILRLEGADFEIKVHNQIRGEGMYYTVSHNNLLFLGENKIDVSFINMAMTS